jgi:hypothetical protein
MEGALVKLGDHQPPFHRNFSDIPPQQTYYRMRQLFCSRITLSRYLARIASSTDFGRDSCGGHAADIVKENVAPVFLDLNRYPTAGQEVVSIPPQPVSVTPAYPNQFDPTIMSGLPPIQTVLHMTLRGQLISFDLHTLEDDPRLIMELLIATSSDRDKWMIVGAFYRRKGNIHAALTVVTTMVKG